MTTLVVGATGATGRWLVKLLLDRGEDVRAIVRSPDKLSAIAGHAHLSLVHADLLALGNAELARHVDGCHAVVSCLGHSTSLRGIYGHPRRLVTEALRRLCHAMKANQPASPVRLVLMNTAGNRNRDLSEPISPAQQYVISLLRLVLPPLADNEQAADYLRTDIGRDSYIEWVVVRPDSLVDRDYVTAYMVHPSPTRSAVFNPGSTSRINVAHFMAELVTDADTWRRWQRQMPVIYDQAAA